MRNVPSSLRREIEGIIKADDLMDRARKGLKVIRLSAWRDTKRKRDELRQELARKGYK